MLDPVTSIWHLAIIPWRDYDPRTAWGRVELVRPGKGREYLAQFQPGRWIELSDTLLAEQRNRLRTTRSWHISNDPRHRCGYVRLGCSMVRSRVLLAVAVLCTGAAISVAQTGTTSGPRTSGQALPEAQGANPFAGSVASKPVPGVVAISLQDAIDRGLKQNLGVLLSNADIQSARRQRWEQLRALLPHVAAGPYIDVSKTNLAEVGFSFKAPGLTFPTSVGPFSYFDARVNVSQSLFDWKSISNARAAGQSVKAAEYTYKDAGDLVVLAVGFSYLQAIADEARIATAKAQVDTAQAIYNHASAHATP